MALSVLVSSGADAGVDFMKSFGKRVSGGCELTGRTVQISVCPNETGSDVSLSGIYMILAPLGETSAAFPMTIPVVLGVWITYW